MKKAIEDGRIIVDRKTDSSEEGYKNTVIFTVNLDRELIGEVIVAERDEPRFLKDDLGEIDLIKFTVLPSLFKDELIGLMFGTMVNYVENKNRTLAILNISEYYSEEFLEGRGFVREPIEYHQPGVYVLGEDYFYNLQNIEKEVHEFLSPKRIK